MISNKIDEELYSIVTQFWSKWVDFDIENIDPIFNSDFELTNNLIEELTKWGESKTIF